MKLEHISNLKIHFFATNNNNKKETIYFSVQLIN